MLARKWWQFSLIKQMPDGSSKMEEWGIEASSYNIAHTLLHREFMDANIVQVHCVGTGVEDLEPTAKNISYANNSVA